MQRERTQGFIIGGIGGAVLAMALMVAMPTIAADEARVPAVVAGWVVLNSNGSIARAKNVTNARRLSEGWYRVTFSRNVSACAFAATPYNLNSPLAALNGLTPRTVDVTSPEGDVGLSLIVMC